MELPPPAAADTFSVPDSERALAVLSSASESGLIVVTLATLVEEASTATESVCDAEGEGQRVSAEPALPLDSKNMLHRRSKATT
mmetsp:Transcript_37262/g.60049  ORF Transcript_37262/g.60049 Transcript_37262/m.60049 type:complete len:84 (-) Transcript_37262:210-461(-)